MKNPKAVASYSAFRLAEIRINLAALAEEWHGVDAHNEIELRNLIEKVQATENEIKKREWFFAALAETEAK